MELLKHLSPFISPRIEQSDLEVELRYYNTMSGCQTSNKSIVEFWSTMEKGTKVALALQTDENCHRYTAWE